MVNLLDPELYKKREKLIKACIADPNDGDSLYELFYVVKPLMYTYMQPYLKHLPHYEKEDFCQIGFITLWRVLKRAAVEPSIIDNFTNYFIVSLKNAYATEFKKFVLNDVRIAVTWECEGDSYNIGRLVAYEEYIQKIKEKKRLADKKYAEEHREKIRECSRRYRAKHKERLAELRQRPEVKKKNAERHRKWREENRESLAAKKHEYYLKHKEEIKAYQKKYAEENSDKVKQRKKQYYEDHKEEQSKRAKAYYQEHKEEIKERVRKYREEHLDEVKAKEKKKRERKKGKKEESGD